MTVKCEPFRIKPILMMPIFSWTFIIGIVGFRHPRPADQINNADGSLEKGLTGYTTESDISVEASLGPIKPTDGNHFALLSTGPDGGTNLPKTDKSSLTLPDFQTPQGVKNLSFDVNFLTNELTPTFTNDFFTAVTIKPEGVEARRRARRLRHLRRGLEKRRAVADGLSR